MVKLTGLFAGKIFLLGPFPRHLEMCCDNPDHAIVDTAGNPVNMINYTLALSKYTSSPGLSHERLHYFEYPAVFGEDFSRMALLTPWPNSCSGFYLNLTSQHQDFKKIFKFSCHPCWQEKTSPPATPTISSTQRMIQTA